MTEKTALTMLYELVQDEDLNNYSDWESEFLSDMLNQVEEKLGWMSDKQEEKIKELYDRHY